MVKHIRSLYGALPTAQVGVAGATIVKDCPIYRDVSDGALKPMATDGVKLLGWANHDAASGEAVRYTPALPGVQVLMDFTGTYAATKLGTYVSQTITSGVAVADLDDAGHDSLRLEELVTNDSAASVYEAWFSAAASANQAYAIEVA